MCLFEDYENLPVDVQAIINTIAENQLDYKDCDSYAMKFNQLGYHCEYDLAGGAIQP